MPWPDRNPSPLSGPVAVSEVIGSQLEKILASDIFAASDSLRRLLDFVVHETVGGRGEAIKEYSLAVSVLGKGEAFDPKADPIVRVQMRRLREHLAEYYAGDGRNDPLIIDIPKGRYVAAFRAGGASRAAPIDEAALAVGHEKELAALQYAFELAAAGNGHLVCLAGEPGIGKTTIVEVFLGQLATRGGRPCVGRARCSERLVGTDAYLPLLEALESIANAGGEPVRRMIVDVAPTWYLLVAPRIEIASPETSPADPGLASQERLKRELVALLRALAGEQPLILFLDDLHWADLSTVDALSYAIPRCASHRILVIGTFRPAELLLANQPFHRVKLELQGHGACREIPVGLLNRADVEQYLALRFAGHRFPPEFAPRLHARTEGNPLFMSDVVALLRDRGVLAQRDGQWILAGLLSDVERDLPESVRSMVQKKVSELTDDDRQLMSAAAVLGPPFEPAVLAGALGVHAADVETRLEALDRARGFVRLMGERVLPDSTLTLEYGFVHVLYQHALLDALTATRKTALSCALAEALLNVYQTRPQHVASRLALLFEAGRDFARASDFFLMASQNAAWMYAAEQAIALAHQAIANAEKLDGDAQHARVMAAALMSGQLHQTLTQLDAAVADFERAERAAKALGDPVAQVNAIFGQGAVLFLAKQIPRLRACGVRATEIARTADSPGATAASAAILAMADLCSGDVDQAEREFDRVIPVLQQCGFIPHALNAGLMRAILHTWRLEHSQAETMLAWSQATARNLRAGFESVIALWHQARSRGNQGRLSEARSLLEDALRLADLVNDRFWRPRIENTRGWLQAEVCDPEGALRLDTDAVVMAREFGDIEAECNSHINAARDYLTLGDAHHALAHLQQAMALYQDDVWFRWVYYPRLQAEMAGYWLAREDLRQARDCATVSLEHAARTSCRKRIVSARKLLGEIALLEERPHEARREFAAALSLLDRYPCPTLEWTVLQSAAAAAESDAARTDLLARAAIVVRSLAESIGHPELQATFLRSKQIRDLLQGR